MGNLKIILAWLKKWRYFLGPIFFLLLFIAMFIYSVTTNLWLQYPLFLKAPLAFEKLSLSVFKESLCHEDCALKRLLARGVLAESLKDGNQATAQKIIKTLKNNEIDSDFKIELLKVWLEVFGSKNLAPEMLAVFQNSSDEKLRHFFQRNFELPLSSWRELERERALDQNLLLRDRQSSLNLLAEKDPDFRSWSEEKKLFEQEQLVLPMLKSLLLLKNNFMLDSNFFENLWPKLIVASEKERNIAIFLARSTLDQGDLSSENFLNRVYSSSEFSIFSRSFAAEILNQKNANYNLIIPEIQDVDWENYLAADNL